MQEFLKIAFVLVTMPIWLPFVKAMVREVLALFEEDGGLFGPDPGPIRRAEIRKRRASQPGVLVHEWLAHVRAGAGQGVASARQASPGSTVGQARRVEATLRPRSRPGSSPGRSTGRTPGPASGSGVDSGSQRPSFRK